MQTAKTLIRLGGCPGSSESSLGAHVILLVLSCCGSYRTPFLMAWLHYLPLGFQMENLYLGDRQSLEAARSELAAVQVKNEKQQNKV